MTSLRPSLLSRCLLGSLLATAGVQAFAGEICITSPTSASVSSGAGSLACGNNTLANANYATTIGHSSQATSDAATAVGLLSTASGVNSLAQGVSATATASSAIATGADSRATADFAIAQGAHSRATGVFGIAVGSQAEAGDRAIAVGPAAQARELYSVAIGRRAQATYPESVAIGASSVTDRPGAVSVGVAPTTDGKALYRQITNVADPTQGTDAANLRTVYAIVKKLLDEHCSDGHCGPSPTIPTLSKRSSR